MKATAPWQAIRVAYARRCRTLPGLATAHSDHSGASRGVPTAASTTTNLWMMPAALLALGLIAALDPVAAASGLHPILNVNDRRLITKICSVCAVGMFWNDSQDFPACQIW